MGCTARRKPSGVFGKSSHIQRPACAVPLRKDDSALGLCVFSTDASGFSLARPSLLCSFNTHLSTQQF